MTLCFKNGTGSKRDRAGGAWTEPFTEGSVRGVAIHQAESSPLQVADSETPGCHKHTVKDWEMPSTTRGIFCLLYLNIGVTRKHPILPRDFIGLQNHFVSGQSILYRRADGRALDSVHLNLKNQPIFLIF